MSASDDLGGSLLAAAITILSVTSIFLAARLYARLGISGGLGWDDALICGSWCFCTGICSAVIAGTQFGFGRHLEFVPQEKQTTFFQLVMVCSTTYSVGVPMAKASFAVLYMRLMQQSRTLLWLNRGLVVFLACQAIEEVLVVTFQCRPVSKAWIPLQEGKCIPLNGFWWSTFVFNLTTDMLLFIQPIPSMWKLQLPLAKRAGLIVMLSLGLLVCIISVIRIVHVQHIGRDSTYELAEPMIWSMVEFGALILCSCIPSLRQVIRKIPWLNRALGMSSGKSSKTPDYGASGSKGAHHVSIALRSKTFGSGKYMQAQRIRSKTGHANDHFGITSRAEAGGYPDVSGSGTRNGSQDEIFPHGEEGGIVVKHEIVRNVVVETQNKDRLSSTSDDSDVAKYPGRL